MRGKNNEDRERKRELYIAVYPYLYLYLQMQVQVKRGEAVAEGPRERLLGAWWLRSSCSETSRRWHQGSQLSLSTVRALVAVAAAAAAVAVVVLGGWFAVVAAFANGWQLPLDLRLGRCFASRGHSQWRARCGPRAQRKPHRREGYFRC